MNNKTVKYEQPMLEIVNYESEIQMASPSVEIEWPWSVNENGYFEE